MSKKAGSARNGKRESLRAATFTIVKWVPVARFVLQQECNK
jgi:hypothetical protein